MPIARTHMTTGRAILAAGKDFEIMLYPRERHGIGTPYRQMHSFRGLMNFFNEYLKGETN